MDLYIECPECENDEDDVLSCIRCGGSGKIKMIVGESCVKKENDH